MGEPEPLSDDEVAVLPIDGTDLGVVLGARVDDPRAVAIPPDLIKSLLQVGGVLGGLRTSTALLDGSLIRLAPETVERLRGGAVFVQDAHGLALGTLTQPGQAGFAHAVRFIPGPSNPVAAGLILQTIGVQAQLAQIAKTLEQIDAKLDVLLQGQRHGALATVLSINRSLSELRAKVDAGHDLSEVDEVKLRDYEDTAREQAELAGLWMQQLLDLLAEEQPTLSQQHDTLMRSMREEAVAFWIRLYIVANLTLGQARLLRLRRATTAELDWAPELRERVVQQLEGNARGLVALCTGIDTYLRRHDIARGVEELSMRRKHRVRRLRRELWAVDEELKATLKDHPALFDAVPGLQPSELPGRLDRRDLEPWAVRDRLLDAGAAVVDRSLSAAERTTVTAMSGIDRTKAAVEKRRRIELEEPAAGGPPVPDDDARQRQDQEGPDSSDPTGSVG